MIMGRTPGARNKTTKEIREMFVKFVSLRFDEFMASWDRLDDKEKCSTFLAMNKFVLPTLSSVDVNDVTDVKKVADQIRLLRDSDKEKK